jgi:hypothetical protein
VRYQNRDQKISIANISNDGVYDPSELGAIESLTFSMGLTGSRFAPPSFGDRPSELYVSFIALQHGQVYEYPYSLGFGDYTTNWYLLTDGGLNRPSTIGLNVNNFRQYPNGGSHPDFSQKGKPLQFGYIVKFYDEWLDAPTGLGGVIGQVYVDNWRVVIERAVPEPSNVVAILVLIAFAIANGRTASLINRAR